MRPVILAFILLSPLGSLADAAVAVSSGNWSNPATWGGAIPGVEEDVSIPAGLAVILDADIECGGITVAGRLEVERADRALLCDTLLVQGADAVFEVGTSANRFLQKFTLTLKGLASEPAMSAMGGKVLGAHNGGTLEIHGRDRIEWTHLGANAAAGATSLTLSEPVDWITGDSILVTSSRLSWSEAETRTITSVSADMKTVFFTPALAYLHNGSTTTRTRSTDGKSWTADLRAEVGLLSRNVKIQGDAASETAGFGGHIMVMNGGTGCCVTTGRAFIEGVELYRMGQKSIVARYPMHWHMCAEGGAGQYFRDSCVRRSFNRAITIHGTESTLVGNNFCYDHLGHGIFLEDGSERFNVIDGNVVLASMRPAAGEEILQTDNAFVSVQNISPSSYWITNPNNTFTNNVAAGTHGTGFWFAFPKKPLNASATHPRFINLEPYKQPLGAFDGNVAHSCSSGLDINDQVDANDNLVINAEWANNGPFYFNDCTWYSNNIAIYAGIGGQRKNVVYRNNVFSDNETNLFLATYQLCEESLMIADSGFGMVPSSKTRTVYAVYDGAGRMKNNHLVGYNASNARFFQNIGAATKHPNHRFEGFTYDPPVPVTSVLTNYNIVPPADVGANSPGHPRIWAQVILDVDGTVGGVPNSSIISNQPFLLTGGETRPSSWTNMYRSSHRFAQNVMTYGLASDLNPNVSVVRTKPGTPAAGVYYINGYKEKHQLPFIVREDFLYTCFYESLPSTRTVSMLMGDAEVGDHYVVCFKEFGKLPGIAVTGMTSRASLAALKAGTTSGFFKESNGDFYVRPVATGTNQSFTLTWSSNITLPVVDSDGDGTSDGAEAAAGTDPFQSPTGTDPFVNSEFNVANNFENWISLSGMSGAAVSSGALSAQSTSTTPQMEQQNLRVSGNAVPYLLVRMKASQNTSPQFSWGRLGATTYTAGRTVSASYADSNNWKVVTFPMAGNTEWSDQIITSLRFRPANLSNVSFQIDWIRTSNGDLDGDGISDAFEGDADIDGDGLVNLEDQDSDGDGTPDATDTEPYINPFDFDQDGIPDINDPDDDNDGTPDISDALPFDPTEQTDTDGDGVGNNADAFPTNPAEQTDTDGDGIGNNADPDDDGDSMSDVNELAASRNPLDVFDLNFGFNITNNFEGWSTSVITSPLVAGGVLSGIATTNDPQLSRSGFSLRANAVPAVMVKLKAGAAGAVQFYWGTAATPGFAGARVLQQPYLTANQWTAITFPLAAVNGWAGQTVTSMRIDPISAASQPFEIDWIRISNGDLDGDGIPDATEGSGDLDGDGMLNLEDMDSDGDGIPDATDPQPYVSALLDFDSDGIPDASDPDDDNDGALDTQDVFPLDPNEQTDTDGDGIGNNADSDDDNDGTPDAGDAFPLDPAEQLDTDLDGIGNNADPDDDNDGFPDATDAFPLDLDENLDTDLDGIGNNEDPDDDNDGSPDTTDAFPLDPNEHLDTDGDTIGNNSDIDDDGDGMSDANELAISRNPLDARDLDFGFNTPGDFEAWNRNNISPSQVAGGLLSGTSSTIDPQITRFGLNLPGSQISQLVVKMRTEAAAGNLQLFWSRTGGSGFFEARSVTIAHGVANTWTAITIPLATLPEWNGQTITQLRIDPVSASAKTFAIDWIRASNGDLDGDGLSDTVEGSVDSDGDGLLDLEDLDSDGDGLSDQREFAMGISPTVPLDPEIDTDGDGQSDLLEIHAGTNRLDPAEHFNWTLAAPGSQPPTITLAVKPGRTYRIHASATLASADWVVIDTIHPAAEGTHEFIDQANHSVRFYRIGVLLDDP